MNKLLLKDLLKILVGKIQIDKQFKWNTTTIYQGDNDLNNSLLEKLKEYLDHEVILITNGEPDFGEDDSGIIVEIKAVPKPLLINPRKLKLLNEKVKKEKYYSIVLNTENDKVSVDVINNSRQKKLKPYWTYSKKEQKAIKKFMLCHKNSTLEYTEDELKLYQQMKEGL